MNLRQPINQIIKGIVFVGVTASVLTGCVVNRTDYEPVYESTPAPSVYNYAINQFANDYAIEKDRKRRRRDVRHQNEVDLAYRSRMNQLKRQEEELAYLQNERLRKNTRQVERQQNHILREEERYWKQEQRLRRDQERRNRRERESEERHHVKEVYRQQQADRAAHKRALGQRPSREERKAEKVQQQIDNDYELAKQLQQEEFAKAGL